MAFYMGKNPNMDIKLVVAQNLGKLMSDSQSLDTVKKVSARSGVGFGTVRRARNGDGNTTVENIAAIAKAFGVKACDLLSEPGKSESALPAPIKMIPKSTRQTRVENIGQLVNATNETGLAIILDKCREIVKEYPVESKQTQSS